MNVGIISDVHGNWPALEAVLAAGNAADVKRWIFAGDLVGYYYWPAQCLRALRDVNAIMIGGNHERMLARSAQDGAFLEAVTQRYGHGVKVALSELRASELSEVMELPVRVDTRMNGRSILVCHGHPQNEDEYTYPDAPSERVDAIFAEGADIVVMGHTHYPYVWRSADHRLAINPGSVGQPRNRCPGAHWALWDTERHDVILRNQSYDMKGVIAEAARRDPALPFLQDVLLRTV